MKWLTDNLQHQRMFARGVKVLFCILLIAGLSACSWFPQEESEEDIPTINPPKLSKKPQYTVKKGTIEVKVSGSGKIMSEREEPLFFTEENRRVKEVYHFPGEIVEAGTVIAELDVSELEAQLKIKELQTRKEELSMIEVLRNSDNMSPDELEQAKIDFELKREEMDKLAAQIERSKLIAPFTGQIATLNINKGDTTKAYQPVALISDLNELTVAIELKSEEMEQVSPGMTTIVDINGFGEVNGKVLRMPLESSYSSQQGYYDQYAQQSMPVQIDKATFYTLIELQDMPEVERGTALSANIITQRKENVLLIPLAALRTYGGRTYVQVIDKQGLKREVDVEIGKKTATEAEVLKGLQVGQKVVGR
jgi:macrolide-specific efflux system membrane fusion protein